MWCDMSVNLFLEKADDTDNGVWTTKKWDSFKAWTAG